MRTSARSCRVCLTGAWGSVFLTLVVGAQAPAATTRSEGLVAKGTRFETPYYVQTSDQPGPTVVITGGVHGDETAGAASAEDIRHWAITRGKLVVLPRANPPALAARSRTIPEVDRELNNLNRNFPRAGKSEPARGEPAQLIWRWVQLMKPTWFVDLHEGGGVRGAGSKSVGSSVIVYPSPEADEAARLMLGGVNVTIEDDSRKFVRLGPPVDGSLARAAGEHLGARAMILETSVSAPPALAKPSAETKPGAAVKTGPFKTASPAAKAKSAASPVSQPQPLSRRVRQHRVLVRTLLVHLGMIDPALNLDQLTGRAAAPGKTWVAVYDAGGTGGSGAASVERQLGEVGMQVLHVGAEEIAAGTLPQFHLLVFPGGSGSKEAAAIGQQGRQQVRQFVENGGGYIGICAGAYLCTSGYNWGLKILDAKTVSPRWARGRATVKMELTPEGRKILGDRPGLLDVKYHNGPIIARANVADLPDYEVLAYFRTEVSNNDTPAGVMVNSPAIAAGRCGQGRVVSISPHPEQTVGLEDLVRRATLWAVGKRGPSATLCHSPASLP